MKNKTLAIFIILAIVIVGVILIYTLNKKETPEQQSEISIKEGSYYDEGGNLVGRCNQEFVKQDVGGLNVDTFYDSNGNFIGNCSTYRGPGTSGGWKGGCSSNQLLKEPCVGSGCGSVEGVRLPKYYCSID